MKRIIDAEVPVIFAGLPKVRASLADEHPDILSRLKVLVLYPIVVEDLILEYKKNFKPEAIEQIYMAVNGDMRKFEEISVDCMDRAKELNYRPLKANLSQNSLMPYFSSLLVYPVKLIGQCMTG